jgi:hypothetical protein
MAHFFVVAKEVRSPQETPLQLQNNTAVLWVFCHGLPQVNLGFKP